VQKCAEQSCGMRWCVTSDQRTVRCEDRYRLALAVGFRGSAARHSRAGASIKRPRCCSGRRIRTIRFLVCRGSYALTTRVAFMVAFEAPCFLSTPSQIFELCPR
jgi:hypothetical protein